jgi:hypothetical protein
MLCRVLCSPHTLVRSCFAHLIESCGVCIVMVSFWGRLVLDLWWMRMSSVCICASRLAYWCTGTSRMCKQKCKTILIPFGTVLCGARQRPAPRLAWAGPSPPKMCVPCPLIYRKRARHHMCARQAGQRPHIEHLVASILKKWISAVFLQLINQFILSKTTWEDDDLPPCDCASLCGSWQEATRARSASHARSTRSKWAHCSRFNQPGERSRVGAVAVAVAQPRGPCSAKLCHGSACACVAKPGCMCFAFMVFAVTVGIWTGTGTQKRSSCALPWTMCASMLDGPAHSPKREIDRD